MKISCLILVLWTALLSGCGTVSTNSLQSTAGPLPQSKPDEIVVLPFETTDCQWMLEVSSADEAIIKNNLPNKIAAALIAELNQTIPATGSLDTGASTHRWLVQGRLRKVELPDPAVKISKRKPSITSTVFIYDLSRSQIQPFLSYDIVAKDVTLDPLAKSPTDTPEAAPVEYLSLEKDKSALLLADTLREFIKNKGW